MKQYYINFANIKTYWEFYEAIIKGMEFPEWCGKNADAIWDLLTGYAEYPAIIRIQGMKKLPKELQEEIRKFQRIMQDLTTEYPFYQFEFVQYD